MSEKLSIAIPTYNRLPYLKECINSILNQIFQDFSIFVFDNASDEPIEEELKRFNDKRIHFIGSNKNIGQSGNINRILGYPFKSKYLTIFHDDDLMHPRMLELQTSFLDANNDIVFVTSDLRAFNKNIHNFQSLAEDKIEIPAASGGVLPERKYPPQFCEKYMFLLHKNFRKIAGFIFSPSASLRGWLHPHRKRWGIQPAKIKSFVPIKIFFQLGRKFEFFRKPHHSLVQ